MLYMDELASTEFRRTYARLTEPVRVTANGHLVGVWTPAATLMEASQQFRDEEVRRITNVPEHMKASTQAQRDALLNKINREK